MKRTATLLSLVDGWWKTLERCGSSSSMTTWRRTCPEAVDTVLTGGGTCEEWSLYLGGQTTPSRHTRGGGNRSTGLGKQAKRVPSRVKEHAHAVLWLPLCQSSPAFDGPLGRVIEVIDVYVEVLGVDRTPRLGRSDRGLPGGLVLHVDRE